MLGRHSLIFTIIGILFAFTFTIDQAQSSDDTCPEIVQTVLETVDTFCADTGRNEACYGNLLVEATPRINVTDFVFTLPGDIAGLATIETMQLNNLDTAAGTWGVAVLKLQANLPYTLPGENVTFLLFGDVSLTNDVTPADTSLQPMQAFYFNSGIGDHRCNEAPDSGILIQTPEGVGTVNLTVNGVDITLGSTTFIQSPPNYLYLYVLEHGANTTATGATQFVPAGTYIRIPLDDEGRPSGPPEFPQGYDYNSLLTLPLGLLPRSIDLPQPLTDEQIQAALNTNRGFLYTIIPGNTLFSIGRCFGVPYATIAAANNITDPSQIYFGQVLYIPTDAGTIPPQPSTRVCPQGVPSITLTPIATPGNTSVCTLNLCYAGNAWGDGRCNDPDPARYAWYWTTGWYLACYEAGLIDVLPPYLLPSSFSATASCLTAGMGKIDYSGAIPGETLTYYVPGCSASGSATATGTSGTITFSCSISTPGPGWIKNSANVTITLPGLTC